MEKPYNGRQIPGRWQGRVYAILIIAVLVVAILTGATLRYKSVADRLAAQNESYSQEFTKSQERERLLIDANTDYRALITELLDNRIVDSASQFTLTEEDTKARWERYEAATRSLEVNLINPNDKLLHEDFWQWNDLARAEETADLSTKSFSNDDAYKLARLMVGETGHNEPDLLQRVFCNAVVNRLENDGYFAEYDTLDKVIKSWYYSAPGGQPGYILTDVVPNQRAIDNAALVLAGARYINPTVTQFGGGYIGKGDYEYHYLDGSNYVIIGSCTR
jgi:hypothetical protein